MLLSMGAVVVGIGIVGVEIEGCGRGWGTRVVEGEHGMMKKHSHSHSDRDAMSLGGRASCTDPQS